LDKKGAAAGRGAFLKTKFGIGPGYLAFLVAFLSAFLAFFAMESPSVIQSQVVPASITDEP
jgi:hypothetical protein